MQRRAYLVAAGVLAVLAVGACSHSSGTKSSAAGNGNLTGLNPGGTGAGAGSTTYGSSSGTLAQARRLPAGLPAMSADSVGTSHAGSAKQLTDASAKIRIASLKVAIKGAGNVASKADQADAIAMQAGGDVDSDDRTTGRFASAALQLRVPPAALQPTLRKLSKLGHELGRQLSTTDVTQQVADVHARLVSANAAIERLRQLYQNKNTAKVRDIIAIENELSSREADLESMQARERALTHETEKATINLTLVTATKKAVVHKAPKKRGGFIGGIQRGWDGFVDAAVWIASAIGTILPFVALVLAVGFAVRRLGWPRHRPVPAPSASE